MQNKWFKVEKKLPAIKELVLLYHRSYEEQHIGWYDGECFNWGESSMSEAGDMLISHWHPLPDDPVIEE